MLSIHSGNASACRITSGCIVEDMMWVPKTSIAQKYYHHIVLPTLMSLFMNILS